MKPASVLLLVALAFLLTPLNIHSQQVDRDLYSGLRWRMIGPFRGGRVNAVSGVTGQPDTFYFGSVGGGLWKSLNSGRTWTPIFDACRAVMLSPERRTISAEDLDLVQIVDTPEDALAVLSGC